MRRGCRTGTICTEGDASYNRTRRRARISSLSSACSRERRYRLLMMASARRAGAAPCPAAARPRVRVQQQDPYHGLVAQGAAHGGQNRSRCGSSAGPSTSPGSRPAHARGRSSRPARPVEAGNAPRCSRLQVLEQRVQHEVSGEGEARPIPTLIHSRAENASRSGGAPQASTTMARQPTPSTATTAAAACVAAADSGAHPPQPGHVRRPPSRRLPWGRARSD